MLYLQGERDQRGSVEIRLIYARPGKLQVDLDQWLRYYNNDRTHQGKMCCGRTPMETLIDGKEAWHDKITTLNN